MIIDVFCHFLPPRFLAERNRRAGPGFGTQYAKYYKANRGLTDLEVRFRVLDQFPDVRQLLTIAGPNVESITRPADTVELARMANDDLAAMVAAHPDRFVSAGACLPMNDVDAALREAERALDQLGFRAIEIFTDINGRALDAPEFYPLYELMQARDLPVNTGLALTSGSQSALARIREQGCLFLVAGRVDDDGAFRDITEKKKSELELRQLNRDLDKKVQERTAQLSETNTQLTYTNTQITDSIRYAQRIQQAILPRTEMIREHFTDAFCMNMPKDLLSGDFYWQHSEGDRQWIAVAGLLVASGAVLYYAGDLGATAAGMTAAIVANGAAFGLGHLFFMHPVTVGMTALGGALIGWADLTRGRSLLLAWVLHSLAGQIIFI